VDFDNDGWLDIFTTNADGNNQLWRNEEGETFTSIAVLGPIASSSDSRGTAWADFDRDGDIDWFVANADGANQLIRNDSPARHWLRVRLAGVSSNVRGVGARIRVVSGGLSQIREITAGNGHRAQDEAIAQFGLGASSSVDSLFVQWPSGTVDVVTELGAIDTEITIVEGEGVPTSAPTPDGVAAFAVLAQNYPNPFSEGTSILFRLDSEQPVHLEVYGADGRLVRSLVDGTYPAGEHLAIWDRRDTHGRISPAGVYFYRLDLGQGGRAARRLVVLD
jgi:hypothetical protein